MNFMEALIFLALLAVLPTTFTSLVSLKESLVSLEEALASNFNRHKVRTLWINSSNLHTEPEIFSVIQIFENIKQNLSDFGWNEKHNISLSENSSNSYSIDRHANSSEIPPNITQYYLQSLIGLMEKTLCDSLVTQQSTCNEKSVECIEQTNQTKIRIGQWCHNIAVRVEKNPWEEIAKLLDLISDPGLLNSNANLTSNSSHIFIEWNSENPEIAILYNVTAYNVSYCSLNKPKEWSCHGKWKHTTVEAKEAVLKTTIGNLEANRKYKIAVVPLFENGMQASEKKYKYIRTKSTNLNASVKTSASHILCTTFCALLLIFFSS